MSALPPPPGHHAHRIRDIEWLAIMHVSVLLLFTAWAYGGQISWARTVLAFLVLGGYGILIAGTRMPGRRPQETPAAALRQLWPILAFQGLGLISLFNPSYAEVVVGGRALLVEGDPVSWLPSTANPKLTAKELWQSTGIVISCFNLYFFLGSRRALRMLLGIVAVNGVILSVFGTFQKLLGTQLYFGARESPNEFFFATFVYHNHWGAFAILTLSASLGLAFHFDRHRGGRSFWNSPGFLTAVGGFLLLVTIPLSTSRSCTALAAVLAGAAVVHALKLHLRPNRQGQRPNALATVAICLLVLSALGSITYLAESGIEDGIAKTRQQLAQVESEGSLGDRARVYRDTVTMARAKPVFGWGLETYAHMFRLFQGPDVVGIFYAEAHSDWLQALAEIGVAGTLLLLLFALRLLRSIDLGDLRRPVAFYLLAGCGVIALYAWIEFPFANPAVLIAFWTCFFSALSWARVSSMDHKGERAEVEIQADEPMPVGSRQPW